MITIQSCDGAQSLIGGLISNYNTYKFYNSGICKVLRGQKCKRAILPRESLTEEVTNELLHLQGCIAVEDGGESLPGTEHSIDKRVEVLGFVFVCVWGAVKQSPDVNFRTYATSLPLI